MGQIGQTGSDNRFPVRMGEPRAVLVGGGYPLPLLEKKRYHDDACSCKHNPGTTTKSPGRHTGGKWLIVWENLNKEFCRYRQHFHLCS